MDALSMLAANLASVDVRIGLGRTFDSAVLLRAAVYPFPAAISGRRSGRDDIATGVGPWWHMIDRQHQDPDC